MIKVDLEQVFQAMNVQWMNLSGLEPKGSDLQRISVSIQSGLGLGPHRKGIGQRLSLLAGNLDCLFKNFVVALGEITVIVEVKVARTLRNDMAENGNRWDFVAREFRWPADDRDLFLHAGTGDQFAVGGKHDLGKKTGIDEFSNGPQNQGRAIVRNQIFVN